MCKCVFGCAVCVSTCVSHSLMLEIHGKSTSLLPFNGLDSFLHNRHHRHTAARLWIRSYFPWFRCLSSLALSLSPSLSRCISWFSPSEHVAGVVCTEYLHFILLIFYNLFILHIYGDKVNILSSVYAYLCCVFCRCCRSFCLVKFLALRAKKSRFRTGCRSRWKSKANP